MNCLQTVGYFIYILYEMSGLTQDVEGILKSTNA